MERPCCYAGRLGSPSAGGNNRPWVLAPMGYLATSPLSRDVSISSRPLRRPDHNFGSFGECPDAIYGSVRLMPRGKIWTELAGVNMLD
jgi:hypothetical protein